MDEKEIKELLQLLRASMKENKELRKEIDDIKSETPDFQSFPDSKPRRGSVGKGLLDQIDEALLLEKHDKPETLSKKEEREFSRNEGLDVVADLAAKLLVYAKNRDIPLRFVKDED